MTEPLLLGMDGGGTATTVWLARLDGTVVGRGSSGPSNIKAVGANTARMSLELSVFSAFRSAGIEPGPVEVSCLGLAGFDREEDRDWLQTWADQTAWARRLVLVNDGDLVVAAGTSEGWGVGLIAGTGSIAVGRAPDGRKARAGGWGFVFGDEGSGFRVAVAALRLVARRHDGRSPGPGRDDPLTRRICDALQIETPAGLIKAIYGNLFDRSRVARLAPAVLAAAEDDPTIGPEILAPAGRELAEMVAAVARSLGWEAGPLPLAMAGGFLLNCPAASDTLLGSLASLGYRPDPRRVPDPVEGALVLARQAATA